MLPPINDNVKKFLGKWLGWQRSLRKPDTIEETTDRTDRVSVSSYSLPQNNKQQAANAFPHL